jgi:hypothetical protein
MYPSFPQGGPSARAIFFTPFDPTYMLGAIAVMADDSLHSAGPAALYNTNTSDPPNGGTPAGWNPRFAMFGNSGNWSRTSPVVWGQRWGLSRGFLITYAGGQIPD